MDTKTQDRVLALAGIFQAARLVHDLAKNGKLDEEAFTTSINSIYKVDAKDVPDVYGGKSSVRVGLRVLLRLFDSERESTDLYISRYVISMIHLEKKLTRNTSMLTNLARRVRYAISQANYFSSIHPTVIASLADIYVSTLGSLPFRIHVFGQAKFLNQTETIEKIRALLLAGVRSAVLWRQLGGSRWHLFFKRQQIVKVAKQLLNS